MFYCKFSKPTLIFVRWKEKLNPSLLESFVKEKHGSCSRKDVESGVVDDDEDDDTSHNSV